MKQLNQMPQASHCHFDNHGSDRIFVAGPPFKVEIPCGKSSDKLRIWKNNQLILDYDKNDRSCRIY